MNIKIVRLKSGEELIGSIVYQDKDVIKIDKACIILPLDQNGQIGLYKFMPYSTIDTDGLQLMNVDTYFVVTPQPDLESYYISITEPIIEDKKDIIA